MNNKLFLFINDDFKQSIIKMIESANLDDSQISELLESLEDSEIDSLEDIQAIIDSL